MRIFQANICHYAIIISHLITCAIGQQQHVHEVPHDWNEFVEKYKAPISERDYDNRIYYVIELHPGINPVEFTNYREDYDNWRFEQPLGTLENHYLYSIHKSSTEMIDLIQELGDRSAVSSSNLEKRAKRNLYKRQLQDHGAKRFQVVEPRQLYKKSPIPIPPGHPIDSSFEIIAKVQKDLDINDPEFQTQWHLINPLQPGHDLNVTGVWYNNITGHGVSIAVVDDGLDMDHDDLKKNYFAAGSWDFNNPGPDPRPRLNDDRHGTRCAGEISAVRNDVCGVGVAYDSNIAGVRILSGRISEADEALSLNYKMDLNDIYSCSWGPPDDGRAVAEPDILVKRALLNGVQNGRDNRGSIFVFASGNGGAFNDNCNFDGYTNSIYSITVAAIDRKGLHPFYSEPCSANLVVTYSSGSGDHIHTTDFRGGCADNHGGTSAAAPIAAGVFALVLEVRPDITWRDMQYLALDTAVVINDYESDWQTTFIGKRFNHKYGYGKLNAYALVERAESWELVNPQAWYFTPMQQVHQSFVHGLDGVSSVVHVSENDIKNANLARLEHVNVIVNIKSDYRGSLTVLLTSPEGIVSELATPRFQDTSVDGLVNWTFMSVVHWGERGIGDWTIKVYNDAQEGSVGTFEHWTLKLWGEAEDASKAVPYKLPGDDLQDDTEEPTRTQQPNPTSTQLLTTESPTSTQSELEPTSSLLPPSSTTAQPSEPAATPTSTNHPWSLVPTFGLSSHTLAWVYGSLLLILGFVGCITVYICVSRRRMRLRGYKRNPVLSSSAYEFDLIPSADDVLDSDADEMDSLQELDRYNDDEGLHSERESYEHREQSSKKPRTLYDTYSQDITQTPEDQEREGLFKVDDSDEEN